MTTWLYEKVLEVDPDREPTFASQSAVNWMAALRHEVEAEHGFNPADQLNSYRTFFRQTPQQKRSVASLAPVFEPLFSSLSGAMALKRLSLHKHPPWIRSTATVCWYYSIYGASRALFAANGQDPKENHSAAMRTFASSLQRSIPHPFNMVARRTRGERYDAELPTHPGATAFNLSSNFLPERELARGMLLQYLSGTAAWYAVRTKERLCLERRFDHFRTKSAQAERDRRLESSVALLHCAFRYRGKANYRDAIYLSYGTRQPREAQNLVANLASVASSFCLLTAAFVEKRLGPAHVRTFFQDIRIHTFEIETADPSELFWAPLAQ